MKGMLEKKCYKCNLMDVKKSICIPSDKQLKANIWNNLMFTKTIWTLNYVLGI